MGTATMLQYGRTARAHTPLTRAAIFVSAEIVPTQRKLFWGV